jgi:glutamate 5-kinase
VKPAEVPARRQQTATNNCIESGVLLQKFIEINPKNSIPVPDWHRAVIKIGSSLIAEGGKKISTKYLLPIASFIFEARNQGKEIILVSSGAVAAGLSTQPQMLNKPQRSIPEKQALAAVGQSLMMSTWGRLFDFPCAQLLLTYDDILNRKRFVNAKNTLMELLKFNVLPIVNENDTVAVDELKVGDNDNLAAYVSVLAEADLLIICSDIDGLYDADPRTNPDAKLIAKVEKIDEKIYALAGGTRNSVGTGGMRTKIQAAEKATSGGINTLIMNGKKRGYFELLHNNILCGTIFLKNEKPLAAKKHWMLHALPSKGMIVVDAGAAQAVGQRNASLLPSGIVAVTGNFQPGDAVTIGFEKDGAFQPIAKGITHYGASDLKKIIGKQSHEIEKVLDHFYTEVIVHRENLVLQK